MIRQTKEIERVPERTWSWLKVNTTQLSLVAPDQKEIPTFQIKASDAVQVSKVLELPPWASDPSLALLDEETTHFMDKNNAPLLNLKIPKDHKEETPIRILFELDEKGNALAEDLLIVAEKGSQSTIIIEYRSPKGIKAYHSGRTRLWVDEGASVKLIKVQLLGDEVQHNDLMGAHVEKGGRLSLVQAEMGAKNATAGWNIVLFGDKSQADLSIVYIGDKEKNLDLTSRIAFHGAKATSNVLARGVLLGKSKKIFRDTLDFISGSKGSKGREEEDVLMLSPSVRNKSVPLLFCGEDDVQGEHAASSSRPNESTLFYLMSRGLSETEAKKLLAQARFVALLEELPDEALKEEIVDFLRTAIEEGGMLHD
jgi:hypothetical protein